MEIVVDNVCFGYPGCSDVLHNINLKMGGPKLYCIIGPNGVGKSTLVKCMNKLLTPKSGTVTLDGRNLEEYSIRDLAKVMSFIPVSQGYSFNLSVADVVLLGRYNPKKWRTDDEDMHMVYKSLRLMGMEDYSMRDISDLSAGQIQKVNLCKGLVQEPKIMILDEPTSNLDVRHQMYVTELLKALSRESEMTIIMISHDLNIASRFADEIVMMAEPGIVHSCGKPEDVITQNSISEVYGVDCEVINHNGKPHVILNSAFSDRQLGLLREERLKTN